jgi:hypothetical protein
VLPLSRTVLPTAPAIRFRLIAGVRVKIAGVTVKIAEAAYAVPSDAITVWIPAATAGTVNAQ